MHFKGMARAIFKKFGYEVWNIRQPHIYSEDGLSTHHVHDFINNARFQSAYSRAIKANGSDHHMRWRAHVALWVAQQVIKLPGDFVECGVSTGFLTSAIMHDLGWNDIGKNFWLFDTWSGLDANEVTDAEGAAGRLDWYSNLDYDKVKANFDEFEGVHMVRGSVPASLNTVDITQVCYLSLDMNCVGPEIQAAAHFWPKIVPGGFMLLDDYAYSGYEAQHVAFDAFANEHGFQILSLPTGQGLAIKPFEVGSLSS